jgi:hypothetical protein
MAVEAEMIRYEETNRGDILKLVGEGAPGFGQLGDLVRVTERTQKVAAP